MSTLFNFLHQNPLKVVFFGYFSTENFTSDKCQRPKAFIREYGKSYPKEVTKENKYSKW